MAPARKDIEPVALAECLLKDDVTDYLLDSRTADQLVNWITEETKTERVYVRLALRILAPLIIKAGRKTLTWGGGVLWIRGQKLLSTMPGYLKLTGWLLNLKDRLERKAEDKHTLDEILMGKRPARDARLVKGVSQDLKVYLTALGELEGTIKAGFAEVVALLKPQPPLLLNLLAPTGRNRLVYSAQRVPFVGRLKERKAIEGFLNSEKDLSWWLITGSGGMGKSRLALELCLRYGNGWRAGFLKTDDGFKSWLEWQPDRPTLMVVDYAGSKSEAVRHIICALHGRPEPLDWPVRMLLLERQAEDQPWWKELRAAGTEGATVDQTCHDSACRPLELGRMSEDDIWSTVRCIVELEGKRLPDRTETLDSLRNIDDQLRPLYASMTAEAIASGHDIRGWGRTDLLDRILEREETRFWKPAGVTTKDRNLVAYATMVGGLPREALGKTAHAGLFPVPDSQGPDRFDPARYRVVTGRAPKSVLAPLEPDIVGEYFVLQHLSPNEYETNALAVRLRGLAWQDHPFEFAQFLDRAARDFVSHLCLRELVPVASANEVQRYYWSTLAFNLINDLGEAGRLEEAQGLYAELSALASAHEGESEVRLARAKGAFNLINDLGKAGRLEEAQGLYAELSALASAHEGESEVRLERAKGAVNLINYLGEAGRLEEAQGLYAELSALASAHEGESEVRLERAKGAVNLAGALLHVSGFDAARSFARSNRDVLKSEILAAYLREQTDPDSAERVFDVIDRLLADDT